ncbi:MAG: hypothetical protein C5B60_04795 [Chloroflexi bacterium]|nr:MAG: hypothetical protein C5B60_04795 [Chloroflexota bacterium]
MFSGAKPERKRRKREPKQNIAIEGKFDSPFAAIGLELARWTGTFLLFLLPRRFNFSATFFRASPVLIIPIALVFHIARLT